MFFDFNNCRKMEIPLCDWEEQENHKKNIVKKDTTGDCLRVFVSTLPRATIHNVNCTCHLKNYFLLNGFELKTNPKV